MKRREFIPVAVYSSLAIASIPALTTSCQKNNVAPNLPNGEVTIDLTNPAYSTLQNKGGYVYTNNIFVINNGNGDFTALSDICTHAGCTVNYDSSGKDLFCPCHGSIFSLTGAVLQGPASIPLPKYKVQQNGNTLTIS